MATLSIPDYQGWKDSFLHRRDGQGGWTVHPAQVQFVHWDTYRAYEQEKQRFVAYNVARMDNDEIILLGAVGNDLFTEFTVASFSQDQGATWEPLRRIGTFAQIGRGAGRPYSLTSLGQGEVMFAAVHEMEWVYFFSHDYGHTWTETAPIPKTPNGYATRTEGSYLVDYGPDGKATRVAAFTLAADRPQDILRGRFVGGLRWSEDRGRTWSDPIVPEAWHLDTTYQGQHFQRGVSEGALVRAANGAIVAAMRVDQHPRYSDGILGDNATSLGVSRSTDDGRTWTDLQELLAGGRHHTHLLRLPDDRLLLTYIMRVDLDGEGHRLSYRKGCGALISSDHGATWETSKEYLLHSFDYSDGSAVAYCNGHSYATTLNDGSVISTYGNLTVQGAPLVKWKPVD